MKKTFFHLKKHFSGSAMLIVIFILSGIFIVAFAAGYRVFFSVKTGDTQSQSFRAAAAADAGAERTRYEITNGTFPTSTCTSTNVFGTTTLSNQSNYTVDCLSTSSPYLIGVRGNFKNIQRYIEFSYSQPFICGNPVQYDGGPYEADGITTTTPGSDTYYRTVQIGSQCWFKDNLNAGAMITSCSGGYIGDCADNSETPNSQADNSTIEKFCYNDAASGCATYGGLYQWGEAMRYGSLLPGARGICPSSWHIPTDSELYTLESGLATSTCVASRTGWDCRPAGTRLKTAAWGGDDSSGFSALITGWRDNTGEFRDPTTSANLWSSTDEGGSSADRRNLNQLQSNVYRNAYGESIGFSVRCLKD